VKASAVRGNVKRGDAVENNDVNEKDVTMISSLAQQIIFGDGEDGNDSTNTVFSNMQVAWESDSHVASLVQSTSYS